ncbi:MULTISPECIES: FmdB family zinc ribbon protein [Cupriavidus]|uniref:Zinc ribbon domain-containing protein n=1 Tax=Cupriavidus pauculus TaxID=82633 RepID=A0A3G8H2G8_9BURK|nr:MULTISPECIES: zinc ribbon domain-containing protein [Cupriavidus]AZG14380.1 zinc ribbon domain-containing protein [Cupriavidus pauculus]MDT6961672.1 zinc ribbon domain-containing protein [Cupriavidus sp. SZY C1]
MPTYDYRCGTCGDFSELRPMARRDEPAVCPGCGGVAARALVAAPGLAGGSADAGAASHGAACACCGPVKLAGRAGGGGWSR